MFINKYVYVGECKTVCVYVCVCVCVCVRYTGKKVWKSTHKLLRATLRGRKGTGT